MKKVMFVLIALTLSIVGYSQSIDERISNTINKSEWQELRSLYSAEGGQLQSPLLHPLSKFFINHFYNQPDSALYYGAKLLSEHQPELGSSVGGIIYLMADDFAKVGDYENASNLLHQFNEALKAAGVAPAPTFVAFENQNRIIAQRGGFSVARLEHDVTIPLVYHHTRRDPGMIFVRTKLNNVECNATYDTGAGVNVLSQELADRLGVCVHDFAGVEIVGVHSDSSKFAIVDSLCLGDIVYRNVPFQIVDFATGHHAADSALEQLNLQCVIGVQTMLPLEEIQFDFKNGNLIVPAKQTQKPNAAPTIYLSGENALILSIHDKRSGAMIDALLDTGASVTQLTSKYYHQNKELFLGITPSDSIRMAGIGGIKVAKTISTQWDYRINDTDCSEDSVVINTDLDVDAVSQYDCLFGLSSLTQHDLVTINFKDMCMKLSLEE